VPEFRDMIQLIERQVPLYDRLVDNLIARQSHDFRLPLRLSWYNSRTGVYSDIADKQDTEFLISSSLVRFAESMRWQSAPTIFPSLSPSTGQDGAGGASNGPSGATQPARLRSTVHDHAAPRARQVIHEIRMNWRRADSRID
jgi:hypothetical protein